MTRLDQYRALAQGQLKANADLLYRHEATWSDGTGCRFSVQDVTKVDTPLTRSLRTRPDAPDVRVLRLPPGPRPAPGASIPWEDGVLFVEHYAQTSDFTETAPGVCRFVAPNRVASYPLIFPTVGPLSPEPGTGNMRPTQGPPLQVVARLEATSDPKVLELVGADPLSTVLYGRWGLPGHPETMPTGVYAGSTSPLTLQGVHGTLTVRIAFPDEDPVQTAIHGEPFLAIWRANRV